MEYSLEYRIEFLPRAKKQLHDAAFWYETKRIGLGNLFLISFTGTMALIKRNPKLFGMVYKQIHRAVKTDYPYNIYFRIDDAIKLVTIIAVLHQHQKPESWKDTE